MFSIPERPCAGAWGGGGGSGGGARQSTAPCTTRNLRTRTRPTPSTTRGSVAETYIAYYSYVFILASR